jgi:4-amino-4-deoxy-L-arabinose transferase-like glycosyltransferase
MTDAWHWAPGTPVLFAAAHLLAPSADGDREPESLRTAFWAQAAVGTALIVVVFLLASGLGGPLAGLLAAGAIATYPPLVRATGDLVSEPLGALTLATAMLALLAAWRRPAWWRIALAGALLGAALLTRADLVPLPALLMAAWVLAARGRAGLPRAAGQALALGAACAAVVAPWCVYATFSANRVVPVASSGPSTLFVGTYLPGDGRMPGVRRELAPYVRRVTPRLADVRTANLPAGEVLRAYIAERHPGIVRPSGAIRQRDLRRALTSEARLNLRTYALGRPLDFAAMEARKVWRMWGGYYRGGFRAERAVIRGWHLLLVGLALAGALAGLALARRRRAELVLLLLPVLLSTAVNAVFVAQPRHNLRVLPLLIAAGAAGAVLAIRALRARRAPFPPPEADPPGEAIYISRGAETPSRSSERESVVAAATQSASLNASSSSPAPTT